jgi:hypothetical protein
VKTWPEGVTQGRQGQWPEVTVNLRCRRCDDKGLIAEFGHDVSAFTAHMIEHERHEATGGDTNPPTQ